VNMILRRLSGEEIGNIMLSNVINEDVLLECLFPLRKEAFFD